MNPKARSGCTVGLPSPGLTRSFTGEGLIYPAAHRPGLLLGFLDRPEALDNR
jgi:hypothetical protein